jgi:hypothetical protein
MNHGNAPPPTQEPPPKQTVANARSSRTRQARKRRSNRIQGICMGRAERDKREKEDRTETKSSGRRNPEKRRPREMGSPRTYRDGSPVPPRRSGFPFFLRERRATGVGEELAGAWGGGTGGKGGIGAGRRARSLLPAARSPSRRAYLDFGGSAAVARACPLASDHVRGADRCHGGAYASPLLCRLSTRCAPRVALSRRRALKRQVIGGSKPRSCVRRNRAATRLVRTSSQPRRGVASYGTARGISAPGLVVRRIRNGHGTPQHAKL